MNNLRPLKYILGIEVARNHEGMYLWQCKYVLDILADTGLLGAKPFSFPMEQNHHLSKAKGAFLGSPSSFR